MAILGSTTEALSITSSGSPIIIMHGTEVKVSLPGLTTPAASIGTFISTSDYYAAGKVVRFSGTNLVNAAAGVTTYLGVLLDGYTVGPVRVALCGATVSGFTGLVPGSIYKIDNSGNIVTLSTFTSGGETLVAKAISTDSLVLFRDQPYY